MTAPDRGDDDREDDVTQSQAHAARLIQRVYRGYRTRREIQGRHLTATNQWVDTVRTAQTRQRQRSSTVPASSSVLQAQRNWNHAVHATKLARGDGPQNEPRSSISSSPAIGKAMDLQYFLEMMDPKHRHGSNLRKYHEYWKTADSHDNFFYWLDRGAGKDVELPVCPREKLEREQVRYLSREERRNYLVKVDRTGRLRWVKNNKLVWTNNTRYEDSLDGVLPIHSATQKREKPDTVSPERPWSESSGSSSNDDSDSDSTSGSGPAVLSRRRQLFNRIKDRIMAKDDWWIFVADPSFQLYIGIKKRGSFQHSSFLRGGRIAAAGLIKIRHGKLCDIAPLSGHYRPPSANFHAFVHSLQDQGADLSRVSLTKLYATLAGMEGYKGTKRNITRAREKVERKIGSTGRKTSVDG